MKNKVFNYIYIFICLSIVIVTIGCKSKEESVHTHTESVWQMVENPTCDKTGLEQTICTDCKVVLNTRTVDIIEHDYINNLCSMCGTPKPNTITPYYENGITYINIGKYPQTVVDDSNLINILDTITITNSLGYIEYNGVEYKKSISSEHIKGYTFVNGTNIEDNTTYYFKVEPIKWRVLYTNNNEYILLSDVLLEKVDFYHTDGEKRIIDGKMVYENNYKYSNSRAWLNGYDGTSYNVEDYTNKGFYDIAFTEKEKEIINISFVDNSEDTVDNFNQYICENTYDKIYLLSYKESINPLYGFDESEEFHETRKFLVSDYSMSKGLGCSWLRSPDNHSESIRLASFEGTVNLFASINNISTGVRPAMKITLGESKNCLNHEETDWVVSKNPSCCEYGLEELRCKKCYEILSTRTIDLIDHNYINSKCLICGQYKYENMVLYTEDDTTYINIGRYPQTVVDNINLINILDTINTKNSLGYIEYNGEEYKKVISSPNWHSFTFINGINIQENKIYYFKVEPIKWRVLYAENNQYTLLCEMLLDHTNFYHTWDKIRLIDNETVYSNNYKFSNIRAWLNGYDGTSYDVEDYTNKGFYDIAFTEEEKALINTTLVDNSASTTPSELNEFMCENTSDKLYLLSYKDVLNTQYGFISTGEPSDTREASVSDYARAKGSSMSLFESSYGHGCWYLRSPFNSWDGYIYTINISGDLSLVSSVSASTGVRPAMKIILE